MKKRILKAALFTAGLAASQWAGAQIRPFYNFQAPDVACMGTFGSIPVGEFTGVPEISIPLLDVSSGSYTLPISASYHLANVRPFPTPGVLGLAWSLEAGGHITRTVRGFPDEKMDSQGHAYGFLGHYDKVGGIVSRNSFGSALSAVNSCFSDNTEGNEYELASDEYSFSFCGHTGSFCLNGNGKWSVSSDEDIKVLFSLSENTVSLSQLESSGRLSTTGWTHRSKCDRFITGFTLLTPDGCRYEFGGLDATDFSIPYYNRANCDLVATTWHLSRIITPEGREISLTYQCRDSSGKALMMCDLRYSPQSLEYGPYETSTDTFSPEASHPIEGWAGFTGFLLFPSYLSGIATPNETLSLGYSHDNTYAERLLQNNGIHALYWNTRTVVEGRFGSYIPADQSLMFMDNVAYTDNPNTMRRRIAARMSDMRLDEIKVTSLRGGGWKKVTTSFDNTKRRRLASLTFTDGLRSHHFGFKYNPGEMCYNYPMADTDSWGYSTGGRVSVSQPAVFLYVPPSLEALRRETLSEITYPSGGKTCLEYELNTYSKRVSHSGTHLISENDYAGGLRVSRVTDRKGDGSVDKIRRFFYCGEIGDSALLLAASSGVLARKPVHKKLILSSDGSFMAVINSKEAFSVPVTSDETPTVGYSCVIEQTIGADGSPLGWVRRRYTNFDASSDGEGHNDLPPVYRLVESDSSQVSPVTSIAYERGKLTSEEFYDAAGNLVKKTRYRYGHAGSGTVPVVHHEESLYHTNGGARITYLQSGCMTETHLRRYFDISVADSTITPAGTYTTRTKRTYNSCKQPSSVTVAGSDFMDRTETYTYAHEKAYSWGGAYRVMADRHVLTPLESVTRKVSGQTREIETTAYSATTDGVPYTLSKSIYQDSQRTIGKEHYSVTCADRYGNPLEVVSDSLVTLMAWSYQGQRPIAMAENIPPGTVSQLSQWLMSLSARAPSSSDYETISRLRNDNPGALFHIYHYDGWLNPLSHTAPDGHTTYYKHDVWGRLREEYFYGHDGTKHILNQYDYHYAY